MSTSSDKIRNIAITGHGSTGKTTLFEQILFLGGQIPKPETVESGKTVSDYTEEETNRTISIHTALAHLPGFIGWHREAVESMLSSFRPIADPELVLFGEVDGEPVGWLPGIANLNEALIHVNGLRHPWDYAKLWWHTRRQPECLTLKSVLVLPAYWGTGVSIVMFDEMARRARAGGFRWVDLSLTSEDNPNTPVLADRMGAEVYKRYRVYRLDL